MSQPQKNAPTIEPSGERTPPELFHPGPANKRRFARQLLLGLLVAIALVALKPRLLAHIESLPVCDRFGWYGWTLLAAFALPTIAAAIMLPRAVAMLNAEQWPPSDAALWAPARILRGRTLRVRAGLLLAWCLICLPFPLYGYFALRTYFFNAAAEQRCRAANPSTPPFSANEQRH